MDIIICTVGSSDVSRVEFQRQRNVKITQEWDIIDRLFVNTDTPTKIKY